MTRHSSCSRMNPRTKMWLNKSWECLKKKCKNWESVSCSRVNVFLGSLSGQERLLDFIFFRSDEKSSSMNHKSLQWIYSFPWRRLFTPSDPVVLSLMSQSSLQIFSEKVLPPLMIIMASIWSSQEKVSRILWCSLWCSLWRLLLRDSLSLICASVLSFASFRVLVSSREERLKVMQVSFFCLLSCIAIPLEIPSLFSHLDEFSSCLSLILSCLDIAVSLSLWFEWLVIQDHFHCTFPFLLSVCHFVLSTLFLWLHSSLYHWHQ